MSVRRLSKSPNEKLGLALIGATALRNNKATFGCHHSNKPLPWWADWTLAASAWLPVIKLFLGNGNCSLLLLLLYFIYLFILNCLVCLFFDLQAAGPYAGDVSQSVCPTLLWNLLRTFTTLIFHQAQPAGQIFHLTNTCLEVVLETSAVNIHGPGGCP